MKQCLITFCDCSQRPINIGVDGKRGFILSQLQININMCVCLKFKVMNQYKNGISNKSSLTDKYLTIF